MAEPEVDMEMVRRKLRELSAQTGETVTGDPLPQATPELGPPTPHGQEAVGVGYRLAVRLGGKGAKASKKKMPGSHKGTGGKVRLGGRPLERLA